MSFIWPLGLFSLALIPILIGLYLAMQARRRRIAAKYGSLGFIQASSGRGIGAIRHVPPMLLLAGLSLLMVASARPQTQMAVPRIEGTVMLAFDVSGSMAADDIKPTRMEAAKAAARQFIEQQPTTVKVGVVAFSDSGFAVQAPTNEKDQILASINRLAPERGTSLANGIAVALRTIVTANKDDSTHFYTNITPEPTTTPAPLPEGRYDSAIIVLLSDGENNEQPDPMGAVKAAADHGVRIYTVGLGSPAGTQVHVNGFTVHTQLDEATLQQVAKMTGGEYYNATSAQDLSKIYDNLDPQLTIEPENIEVTSIFAGASGVVLLLGGLLSLLWFSRLP